MATATKTNEDLQRELLETQLDQAKIALEQTKEANASYRQRKEVASRANAQRQAQLHADHASLRNLQKNMCQHMAGGDAGSSPLEGGGKFAFSVIGCVIAPDGVTKWLLCPRCRLFLKGRERTPQEEAKMQVAAEAVEKKDPKFATNPVWLAWDDHQWWKDVYRLYRREGLGKKSLMRGPTFNFQRADGTGIIPETAGYSTSGAGGR